MIRDFRPPEGVVLNFQVAGLGSRFAAQFLDILLTLFLIFGAAPAALGLALGLLIQGLMLAPFDLPQYGMNMTTLLVPLFALQFVAKRIIAPNTAYVDLKYSQALALSTAYQAGVVGWVAFWAFYGQGFGAENIAPSIDHQLLEEIQVNMECNAPLAGNTNARFDVFLTQAAICRFLQDCLA